MTVPMWEGRVALPDGYERYVQRFGDGPEVLLALHGGPGADSRWFAPLSEIADGLVQVVVYDQLGGGRSDRPDDDDLWTTATFVEEFRNIVDALEADAVHLLGESWGGMLALECTLEYPELVKSLILCDTMASTQAAVDGFQEILASASDEARRAVAEGVAFDPADPSPASQALLDLYATHCLRSYPFDLETSRTEFIEKAMPLLDDLGPAYEIMWGPSEFAPSGRLRDWDVSDRLHEITQPALVACGLYDELTLSCHQQILAGLGDAQWLILGQSSHSTLMEKETSVVLDAIGGFVRRQASRDHVSHKAGTVTHSESVGDVSSALT